MIDKLAELLKWTPDIEVKNGDYYEVAKWLVENNVIVPPCKVGDKVWELYTQYNGNVRIREGKISMLTQKADKSWKARITVNSSVWDFKVDDIGIRYFLTKEEAERELEKRCNNA